MNSEQLSRLSSILIIYYFHWLFGLNCLQWEYVKGGLGSSTQIMRNMKTLNINNSGFFSSVWKQAGCEGIPNASSPT